MSEPFFLRLRQSLDTAQWCVGHANLLPAHNDRIQSGTLEQALDAALAHENGQHVVLIVPAADIVLSSVNLPIRQTAKLLQAVPYAVEDQLAEDVDELHFAIGQRQPDGSVPVASVARDTLEGWLAPLKERGIEPVTVLPEMLCLPHVQAGGGWQILLEGRDCTVRNGPYSGFCCDVTELDSFLSMALTGDELPEGLRMRLYQVAGSQEAQFADLGIEVETVSLTAGLACLMQQNYEQGINLLQGAYASQPAYERWWRPVRLTAMLFIAWGLLSTLYFGLQYWQIASEVEDLETSNRDRFQQIFPELTRIVDMRVQGEQRVRELREGGGSAGLFPLLGATADATQQIGDLQLQELQMRDATFYMSLTATNIQTLDQLRSHFEEQPAWTLEVQSANAGTDGVQIRASLKGNRP